MAKSVAGKSKSKTVPGNGATAENILEVPWYPPPGHFNGALSKRLVSPAHNGSKNLAYVISCYAPGAFVKPHAHKVREQVYHVIEGEGIMEIAGKKQIARKHDVFFFPPGVEHAIYNEGTENLVFIVASSPPDEEK